MNPYYNPEEMGLEKIVEIDYSSGSYEFDIRIVWKHTKSKKYYTARDSGCSCPVPFETYSSIESLEEYSFNTIRQEALDQAKDHNYRGSDIHEFIKKLPKTRIKERNT